MSVILTNFYVRGTSEMKRTLNLTVDESGDFGTFQQYSPYYIVAILFHDGKDSIEHAALFVQSKLQALIS